MVLFRLLYQVVSKTVSSVVLKRGIIKSDQVDILTAFPGPLGYNAHDCVPGEFLAWRKGIPSQ